MDAWRLLCHDVLVHSREFLIHSTNLHGQRFFINCGRHDAFHGGRYGSHGGLFNSSHYCSWCLCMSRTSWPLIRIPLPPRALELEAPFPPIPARGAIVPAVVVPAAEAESEVEAVTIVARLSFEGDEELNGDRPAAAASAAAAARTDHGIGGRCRVS